VGKNHSVKVIELDNLNNGSKIQAELLAMTGQRTVPNVFIKGKHLGGNDDTHAALASGKLQAMLSSSL
jgi:glutaredoxin 3